MLQSGPTDGDHLCINIPIGILTYEIKINVSDIIWTQPNSGVHAVPQYHLCGKPVVSNRDFINSIILIPIFGAITYIKSPA